VGDVAFQKKCLGKMGEVSRDGRTVLFVSHNLAAIENLCSRAIVLSAGTLHFDGSPKDAIHYYLNSLSTQSGTGGVIELDNVGERRSTLGPLLKRLEFLTEGDQPVNQGVPVGGRLKIKVHFELPDLTDRFHVGIGFNNIYGQRIFTAYTYFEPSLTEQRHSGRQVYCCDIPSLTLVSGEYSVKVWLDLKNVQVDTIEDAARITVLESDFYGTGKVPWNGLCVMKHRWQLEQPVGEAAYALQNQAGS
jgi:lipopolysaccharide transport system ATP-binding protein